MAVEPLAKLFGSSERLKIMRFFLFNPKTAIGVLDLAHSVNLNSKTTQKEMMSLAGAGFIKKKIFYRVDVVKKKDKTIQRRERVKGWVLDESFPYLSALKELLVKSRAFQTEAIVEKFRNVGRIKLLLVSGVFIQNPESMVDILVVGDSLRKALIKRVLRGLEQDIGRELRYSLMNTEEFAYRRDLYDKFLRDILDNPHERLIEKIDLR